MLTTAAPAASFVAARTPPSAAPLSPKRMLALEARSLLTRLDRVRSFALYETMVPAASLSVPAQAAIEKAVNRSKHTLRHAVEGFVSWLDSTEGRNASPAAAQRRFTILRLRFNAVLSDVDIFAEVVTQRSEYETGVFLAGLDVAAADALAVPGAEDLFDAPPLMCFLARGPGAAIRRARTRMPTGGDNPVGIVRIPRERMIGSGIASSLVHEVGHQGAALLDLVATLRDAVRERGAATGEDAPAWQLWERWISEIVADFWAAARLGITATHGLLAVVTLPAAFVFRPNEDDPHPTPWIRVLLSCAMGRALYPHRRWDALAEAWREYYPVAELPVRRRAVLAMLERTMPELVELLLEHRSTTLGGRSLGALLRSGDRSGERLTRLVALAVRGRTHGLVKALRDLPPTLALAALGQARFDETVSPEVESQVMAELLSYWALRATIDMSEVCATRPAPAAARRAVPSRALLAAQMSPIDPAAAGRRIHE